MRVAGGRNDLENVGRTGKHATFLEMLGNFSFGDYYKREAIVWAWEYLTRRLAISPERLAVSVYVDDEEAAGFWRRDIGLPEQRISRFREENFWDMGPTGPCGPCSEIFYDLGSELGCGQAQCGPGCAHCDRFIELWNLVFQQFDRDSSGELHPLPRPCIDTGMGFERLCMVLNGLTSIFETDLYADIIAALPPADTALSPGDSLVHRRIVADHARAAVFLVADGIVPANTDRGYVLRFITRRALRSGKLLGYRDAFFAELVPTVVRTLADGYPQLPAALPAVVSLLATEEKQFEQTLARGESRLRLLIEAARQRGQEVLGGDAVFELHDTYGFPAELTAEIAREAGMAVDMRGFRAAMQEQRERARRGALAVRRLRCAGGARDDSRLVRRGWRGARRACGR
jgi:alanyl-tRNA synthetase